MILQDLVTVRRVPPAPEFAEKRPLRLRVRLPRSLSASAFSEADV